eukprot:GHVU01015682.1.p1 GENE.GHVU01015682.1~~GHVU01015682.1.p1  ORF type:complete len:127 (+),score=2.31 GHVU01015682.1:1011-1391(+)
MAPREPNNTKQFHDNRACGDSSLQSATNVRSCTQAHSLADTVTAGSGPYRFAQPHSRPMSSAVRADLNMRSIFKQRRRAITLPTGSPSPSVARLRSLHIPAAVRTLPGGLPASVQKRTTIAQEDHT